MAERKNSNIIILPIYPKYAQAIVDGKKKIEFRKTNIPESITHVIVYSTAPIKKVIGYFSVAKIAKQSPSTLWEDYGQIGMVDKNRFFQYYASQELGVGILVSQVWKLENPFPLKKINGDLNPPQAFAYYNQNDWRNIKRRKKILI